MSDTKRKAKPTKFTEFNNKRIPIKTYFEEEDSKPKGSKLTRSKFLVKSLSCTPISFPTCRKVYKERIV